MKVLKVISVVSIVVVLASCGNKGTNDSSKSKADSTAKGGDTSKHGKIVIALAKDTNRNNYTDANGKRQGHWIITNLTEHLPGYGKDAKVAEGEYQDGMKEGEWTEYNADGSVKSTTTFNNDKPVQ